MHKRLGIWSQWTHCGKGRQIQIWRSSQICIRASSRVNSVCFSWSLKKKKKSLEKGRKWAEIFFQHIESWGKFSGLSPMESFNKLSDLKILLFQSMSYLRRRNRRKKWHFQGRGFISFAILPPLYIDPDLIFNRFCLETRGDEPFLKLP